MADQRKTSNSNDDDFQTGIPYAKADPYTPPDPAHPTATRRETYAKVDPSGKETEITGGLQDVTPVPISLDEFNAKARGGAINTKSWQRAIANHQHRRGAPAPSAPTKPKSPW